MLCLLLGRGIGKLANDRRQPDSNSSAFHWSELGPATSTAETRTEKRAPVLVFCSAIPRKSHAMAVGISPLLVGASQLPTIVYVLPVGSFKKRQATRMNEKWRHLPSLAWPKQKTQPSDPLMTAVTMSLRTLPATSFCRVKVKSLGAWRMAGINAGLPECRPVCKGHQKRTFWGRRRRHVDPAKLRRYIRSPATIKRWIGRWGSR